MSLYSLFQELGKYRVLRSPPILFLESTDIVWEITLSCLRTPSFFALNAVRISTILLPTMRNLLLFVVCWVWAGLRWWRRRRRRRGILVRCSETYVVIPNKSLKWVPVLSSSWHNVLLFTHQLRSSHTQNCPIQLVSLWSCVYLHVGPNTAGYDASRNSYNSYSATCDVSLS